jgi:hypothetical protein
VEEMRGERVHHRDICDGDAPREDHEDVPSGLVAGSGAICCSSRTSFEARETAKGRFEGRGNTGPVHSTAQYPFEDVVAQRKLCGQGAASHGMVGVHAPECSPAAALHSRGVERQHWEAEAMAEGSLYFSALECQGVQERESVQPSRGRAACAAEEAGAIAFARLRAGVTRGEEGVKAKLGNVPRVGALRFRDVSQAVGVNLT